ncbi:PAS domain-containing sensor histidine kinase [Paenibacillus sp. MSJ-34]|uniref:PAS domain-containing sensor histidine kinase n=1 Tax=Paenibacillus sp. MSJ-34 TaxID=2841529 RepID=UPI001C119457|nr:PAS domain S-box protein [Paenibacillus sp. MSJ-34]
MTKRTKANLYKNSEKTGTSNAPRDDCREKKVAVAGVDHDIAEIAFQNEKNGPEDELGDIIRVRESEERYRQLVELSPEPIVVYSDRTIVYVNPAGAELIGVADPNELYGKSIGEYFFAHASASLFDENKIPIEGTVEMNISTAYGQLITIEAMAVPIRYRGEPAVQLLCRDITDRKKAIESEYRYQRLLKLSPVPIILHRNDLIVDANDAAVKLLGAEKKTDMIGQSVYTFIHPDYYAEEKKRLESVVLTDDHLSFREIKLNRLDGRTIDVEASAIYIYKDMGSPVVQSVFQDLTERKRTEELIRRSEKLSVIGQLAAGVAHEIRNPLTSLKGFTQLLKSKHNQDQDFYSIMLTELDRINFIVNEFMTIAKPQAVKFEPRYIPDVIHSVVMLVELQAILNNVQIVMDVKKGIPLVECDENQFKQVFINLLKNAIEAMDNGGTVTVHIRKGRLNQVHIRIVDQGPGIDEERIGRLGEPFFTTKESGTGLGLVVSCRIIEAHGGTISFSSKLNRGTTVDIVLPPAHG